MNISKYRVHHTLLFKLVDNKALLKLLPSEGREDFCQKVQ